MTNQDELDAIRQTRGTCPICAEDGNTLTRQLHGLASHLMKEHTVDQLAYQIAGEAVIDALDEEEQPKFATGGLVKGSGRLVAGNGVDCVFPFTADAVRAANPSPAIDPESVASDAIRVHLSPAESVIPGPNGPIHIRGAYGDEPAQVTEIDMDDLEGGQ